MATIQPDYSTINLKALRKLPIYILPPTYRLSDHLGQGCYGDAPGYPSYFLQSVYTQHGNSPRRGPETVIAYHGVLYVVASDKDWQAGRDWEAVRHIRDARLRRLWAPLPYESERVQAWIKHTYQHMAHCYGDPSLGEKQRQASECVIWPVPYYKLPLDPRKATFHFLGGTLNFTDLKPELQKAELRAYRLKKRESLRRAWDICKDPANHLAALAVQEFYPEHTPNLEYIAHPPKLFQEDWIVIYDHRPNPDECPGHLGSPHGKFDNCRMCGRTDIGDMERKLTAGRA